MGYSAYGSEKTLATGGHEIALAGVAGSDGDYAFLWPQASVNGSPPTGEIYTQNGNFVGFISVPNIDDTAITATASGLFVIADNSSPVTVGSPDDLTLFIQSPTAPGTSTSQVVLGTMDFLSGVAVTASQAGAANPGSVAGAISYYDTSGSTTVKLTITNGTAPVSTFTVATPPGLSPLTPLPVELGSSGLPTQIVQLTSGNYAVEWSAKDTSSGTDYQVVSVVNSAGTTITGIEFPGTGYVAGSLSLVAAPNDELGAAYSVYGDIYFALLDGSNAETVSGFAPGLVSPGPDSGDVDPQVTLLSNGDFAVAWYNGTTDIIDAQILDSSGNNIGSMLNVSQSGENLSSELGIASLPNGRFVVAWEDTDGSMHSQVMSPTPEAPTPADFNGDRTSDILFRNDSGGDTGFYQITNGANAGWNDVGASSTAYGIVGTGDFYGTGTTDVLYRNNATGDTGFYQIVNGANTGWHDIGASSTAYSVVGVGDFIGSGTDDVLYRNNATGDTGFYEIVNGVNTGWQDIGASSTAYSVVGVGDFTGDGTDDILYRNNTTGDTGFYEIANGVNTGWQDVGASSTAYSVVGVGDFLGNGTDDILYRNNTTGDTGFYAISNGVNTGWHDIGASSTAYSVVAVGDYMGNGTDDILFRNNTTGDTGFYAISNGVNAGWHDVGVSSTAYHVIA
jgi:hypothetical protein